MIGYHGAMHSVQGSVPEVFTPQSCHYWLLGHIPSREAVIYRDSLWEAPIKGTSEEQ